jgi:hypothetical protein
MLADPNTDSLKEVMEKYGLTKDEALGKFRLYNGWAVDKEGGQ